MWAVYFCGCTDCFMQAMFIDHADAEEFAKKSKNPEGFFIKHFEKPEDIDRTDTGWWDHEKYS